MPQPGVPLEKLGFLTIGLFDGQDPGPGHQETLEMIELGTAVIPLGWENPLRLAEDLATVDTLSGGRLNPGFSVGPPRHWAGENGVNFLVSSVLKAEEAVHLGPDATDGGSGRAGPAAVRTGHSGDVGGDR